MQGPKPSSHVDRITLGVHGPFQKDFGPVYQEIVNATIATISSLETIIKRVANQIEKYQHQIQHQLKIVT